MNPTDNLHILTGTRYSHWKRDWSWDYDLSDGKPDTRADREQRTEKSRFVPYLGVTYDLDPNNSLYASYTSIFKYNTNPGKNGQPLPATLGNNYEVGWKGEWYNGDLNASVALFQIDQKNTAINSRQRLTDGSNRFYFEPMTLQSRGLDAEISGKLTDQWQMFAGYTYNTRKYTKTAGRQTLFVAGADFSQHTPRHMLRVHTAYRLPGAASRWTLTGGFSTQSKHKSWDVAQPLGGYTVWNAGVQYEPNKHMKLTLNVNNLTDKRYYENYEARTKGWGWFYGEPRNVTLNFKWKL